MPKLKFKHGPKSTLPKLDFREPAITDDTEEVFVGGNTENIQLAKTEDIQSVQDDLNSKNQSRISDIATLQADVNTKNNARIQDIADTNTRMNTIIGDNGNSNEEIVDARGGYPLLRDRLDNTAAQLAQITSQRYFISDIQGIVLNDSSKAQSNTDILNSYIANVTSVVTLVMPLGTLYTKGLALTRTINIEGLSKYGSKIVNVGTGLDALTISADRERGYFSNLSIIGNGTQPYGTDATSGKGIVFNNNSCIWHLDNVYMYGHGDHFIYADGTGNVNNINITNCELENGKKTAIHLVQSSFSNQINALLIKGCNISGFATNGMELWGSSITVQDNAIQACKNKGIVIDGSISPSGDSTAQNIRIDNNYFELCNYGFIYCNSINSPVRYLNNIVVSNNYGLYGVIAGDTVTGNVYCVEVNATYIDYATYTVSSFVYLNNSFATSGLATAILNGNNCFIYDSVIQRNIPDNIPANISTNFINLGRAKILDNLNKKVIVKGIISCFNKTYTIDKSPNITTTSELDFDFQSFVNGIPTKFSFPIQTDSTNYAISAYLYYRDKNTTGAFTQANIDVVSNKNGNFTYNLEPSQYQITTNLVKEWYIGIEISFTTVGTYLYVGNVEISYFD